MEVCSQGVGNCGQIAQGNFLRLNEKTGKRQKPRWLLVRDAFVACRGSASFVSGTSRWWSLFSAIRDKSTPELPQSGSRAPSLVAGLSIRQ